MLLNCVKNLHSSNCVVVVLEIQLKLEYQSNYAGINRCIGIDIMSVWIYTPTTNRKRIGEWMARWMGG